MVEPSSGLGSLVQIGIGGENRPAWELAAGVRGVAPSASGFHRQWVIALNSPPCFWREGGGIGMDRRDFRDRGQHGQQEDRGNKQSADTHASIHTRILACVN